MKLEKPESGRAWLYREARGGVAVVMMGRIDAIVQLSNCECFSRIWGTEVPELVEPIKPVPFPPDELRMNWEIGEAHLVELEDGSFCSARMADDGSDGFPIRTSHGWYSPTGKNRLGGRPGIVADLGSIEDAGKIVKAAKQSTGKAG